MTEHDLPDLIRVYWRQQGYAISASVREVSTVNRAGAVYRYSAIGSDLVNGLPAGYRGELAVAVRGRKAA